jgi:hypothetical protein
MSQRRDALRRIRIDMADAGTAPAFSPLRMREQDFISISGAYVDVSGALRKFPELIPIGGMITEPNEPRISEGESVKIFEKLTTSLWPITSSAGNGVVSSLSRSGVLRANIQQDTVAAVGHATYTRASSTSDAQNTSPSYDGDVCFEFSFKANALPGTMPTATDPLIQFQVATKETEGFQFRLTDVGVEIRMGASSWVPWAWPVNVLDGKEHRVRVQIDSFGAFFHTEVYVDGIDASPQMETITRPYAVTTTDFVTVTLQSSSGMGANEIYGISLWNILLRDDVDDPVSVGNITNAFSRSSVSDGVYTYPSTVFVGTDKYVWIEENGTGIWTVLAPLGKGKARFSSYKESVLIFDYGAGANTSVLEYMKNGNIRILDDAPNIVYAAQHANRLWGFGGQFPLRLYYSGDRRANVWFSPETDADGVEEYDEVMDAGYISIPGEAGEVITAVWPEFNDILLVFTDRSTYAVRGASPMTFSKSRVTNDMAALSQECVTKVGNDIWSVGMNGINSLATTDKYGDIIGAKISLPIQNIFTPSGRNPRKMSYKNQEFASLAYEPASGLVVLHITTTSEQADSVWLYNVSTQKWYGPTEIVANRVKAIDAGSPERSVVVFGRSDGFLVRSGLFEDTSIPVRLQLANLSGRSVAGEAESYTKTWRTLRLFYSPRGDWPITVRWRPEGGEWRERIVPTVAGLGIIGSTWEVDHSAIIGDSDVAVLEVPIDVRGRALSLELSSVPASMSILSMEIEFAIDGYERGM